MSELLWLFFGLVVYMPASVWAMGWVYESFGIVAAFATGGLAIFIMCFVMMLMIDI